MFLTDNDPPQLKDLTLASIVLSGTETTQVTISGTSTTGILQSGASTTAYSITGAFTTGISIAADGTTAISVTSGFTGTTGLLFAGTATNGISITGACTTGISVTGICTDGISVASAVNPSAACNGIKVAVTAANTWSGSVAGVRSTVTSSATAGIGNMYGGRFQLTESALPSSQGHTCALYAETSASGTGNNPTSVLSLCHSGDSTGVNTPFINFLDSATNKTTYLFEIGTGDAVGTNTNGTALYETAVSIGNVDEITAGLRVKVNGVAYYLLMATPANIED